MIILYIKTHNVTKLKYFGKTTQDPFNYNGSGGYWLKHLNKHGFDITTEIYGSYTNVDDAKDAAIKFSIENDIVNSTEWANLIIESITGGDTSDMIDYKCISAKMKKFRWWNNGNQQAFSEFPPDDSYGRGRLKFNNVGSKLGALKNKNSVWVNNGSIEKFVGKDLIPPGFNIGRLPSTKFKPVKTVKGTKWWNNDVIEVMSEHCPDITFRNGRLKRQVK